MSTIDDLLAKDLLPDFLIRYGIRQRLQETLDPFEKLDSEGRQKLLMEHLLDLKNSPIAIATDEANEQHYGNDPAFFLAHLGPKLKYSSCEWPGAGCTLAEAEDATTYFEMAAHSDAALRRLATLAVPGLEALPYDRELEALRVQQSPLLLAALVCSAPAFVVLRLIELTLAQATAAASCGAVFALGVALWRRPRDVFSRARKYL